MEPSQVVAAYLLGAGRRIPLLGRRGDIGFGNLARDHTLVLEKGVRPPDVYLLPPAIDVQGQVVLFPRAHPGIHRGAEALFPALGRYDVDDTRRTVGVFLGRGTGDEFHPRHGRSRQQVEQFHRIDIGRTPVDEIPHIGRAAQGHVSFQIGTGRRQVVHQVFRRIARGLKVASHIDGTLPQSGTHRGHPRGNHYIGKQTVFGFKGQGQGNRRRHFHRLASCGEITRQTRLDAIRSFR